MLKILEINDKGVEKDASKKDFKKKFKHLYSPSAVEVTIVEVIEMQFLSVDGQGVPNTSQ